MRMLVFFMAMLIILNIIMVIVVLQSKFCLACARLYLVDVALLSANVTMCPHYPLSCFHSFDVRIQRC